MSLRRGQGFTIVELLVTLAVISAVAAIAIPHYSSAVGKARTTRAIAEIRLMEREIAKYEMDHEQYPAALADTGWRANDPWGNPYQYLRLALRNGEAGPGNQPAGAPAPKDAPVPLGGGNGNGGGGGTPPDPGGGGGGGGGGTPPGDPGGGGGGGTGQARKDRFLVPLNSDFDLYSTGRDGRSAPPLTAQYSRDDIVRAVNGGYVGLASEF